jgi:hypothetical protein
MGNQQQESALAEEFYLECYCSPEKSKENFKLSENQEKS